MHIHNGATSQLYPTYNLSKVRSGMSWDVLVDIPGNTEQVQIEKKGKK